MANEVNSIYMSLPVPVVGVDPGPQYATDVNACLTIIDQHDHLTGSGVPITSAAININGDLPFNNNNLTSLRSLRLQPQVAPIPATGLDLGCIYESGVDLYYNDGAGNQIRITQSGGVAGTPGSIANLTPPASASYVALSATFVWQSAANTAANLDTGSIILRNLTLNSKGLTLSPPNAMGADYSIILPALPASNLPVSIDNAGNMTANPITFAQLDPSIQLTITKTAPTIQRFIATGTTTGYLFTVSGANATVGATYTNNGHTFTVSATITAGSRLFTTAAAAPTSSGTLTKASGTGDATIAFSAEAPLATYTTPTSPAPLYVRVKVQGAGGGGGGGGAAGGNAGTDGIRSTFGTEFLIAGAGTAGAAVAGGSGGIATIVGSPILIDSLDGGSGTGAPSLGATGSTSGGAGGSGFFGGAGGGGAAGGNIGRNAATNSGSGGGGGGSANGGAALGGGGGGSGAFICIQLNSPTGTYSYSVGGRGSGGSPNASGGFGGDGADGIIIVEEYYQ